MSHIELVYGSHFLREPPIRLCKAQFWQKAQCTTDSQKKMVEFGVIGGRLYEVWEVYGDTMGVIGGHLYEVWEEDGDPIGA